MKLNYEQIKEITTGAVSVLENDDKIEFHRFTDEQEIIYGKISKEQDRKFNERCKASAGIRLWFKTDSKTLKMVFNIEKSTSRLYFSVDVFENGKFIGAIDNYNAESLPQNYTEVDLPLGEFSKEFKLSSGEKEICVYLPWSVCPTLLELSLDDGAYVKAVKPKKTLLAFGDSITQGYDALRSSNRYVARLCDKLGVMEINKGIGGEVFFPELAKSKDELNPDYITVAYGTNDFSTREYEDFKIRCKQFFEELSRNYKTSKIFAITPIWRKDYMGERVFGEFFRAQEYIKEICEKLENVTVISGFDLVPKDEKYYSDLRLHPNDKGFEFYAENLYNEIKKYL